MRKVMFLLIGCMILLVGCGGKPSGVSQEMYDTAVYIIDVTDMYLEGDATLEETYEKVDSLTVPEVKDSGDSSIEVCILDIRISLLSSKESIGTMNISDVKDARDKLAEEINYKD